MENKIKEFLSDIKYLLHQSEEHSKYAAAGYDEGWYHGECNAYEIVLEQLENIVRGG